jgi:L-fucose mutarotase/ribose pyranase (RbsD/FucU family)
MNTDNKKNTNPLYVVRNNGVDVEEANSILELILKKTGLDKMVPMLEMFMQVILSQVQSYPVFIEVKKMLDQLFEKVIEIIFQIQQMTAKKKA